MCGGRDRTAASLLALLTAVALVAGCGFEPQFPDGKISCRTEKDCPPAYACLQSLCYSRSSVLDGAITGAGGEGGSAAAGATGAAGGAGPGNGGNGGNGGDTGAAGSTGGGAGDTSLPPDAGATDAQVDSSPGDGGCTDACTMGAHRCGTTGLQTCVKVGACTAWSVDVACGGRQTCQVVGADSRCACPAKPAGCDGGVGAVCTNAMLRTCAADADGCIFEKALDACPAGKPCAGTFPAAACTCAAPPALCASKPGTVCESATSVATCSVNADGCLEISKHTTCAAGKPCAGNAPSATCSCTGSPPECAGQAGMFCHAADGQLSTCDLDSNGCLAIIKTAPCATGLTCQGAAPSASCKCPAPPTECVGGIGTACRSTAQVVTCARDASGCLVINSIMTCAAGKPCTGSLPSAACTCPTPPTDCAAGTGALCAAGKLETCGQDANGCVVLASALTCPAGKPCGGSFPNASCMCPATPAGCGSGVGNSCSGTSVVACTLDANSCYQAATSGCPAGKPCGGGFPNAVCTCPAAPAGCASGVGSSCSANSLITCSKDANLCFQAVTATCGAQFCTGSFPASACVSPQALGFSSDLGGMSKHSANQLLGVPVTVTGTVTLRHFGLIVRTGSQVTMALYKADATGAPSTLVASVVGQTLVVGSNEYPVITQPTLTAGTYWIMAVFDVDMQVAHDTTPNEPTRFIAQTFSNPLPGTLATTNVYTGTNMDFYILVLP
jgi:hypothetical protein